MSKAYKRSDLANLNFTALLYVCLSSTLSQDLDPGITACFSASSQPAWVDTEGTALALAHRSGGLRKAVEV